MILTLTLRDLQQEAADAVWAQAFTDERGVLGVATSLDGLTWSGHWDITAIDEAIEAAAFITWVGEDLRLCGRWEASARHFRVARPADFAQDELRAYAAPALPPGCGRTVAWEVIDPAGRVLVRADIELAERIYHGSAAGSRLRHVLTTAGHYQPTWVLSPALSSVSSTSGEAAA